MNKLTKDHYTGCLLGGAIGDALGAPIEFDTLNEIYENHGHGGLRHYVELPGGSGAFTDDTQMTLFTAEGLLRAQHRAMRRGIGGAEVTMVYQSYLRWLYTQDGQVKHLPDESLQSGWLIKERCLHALRAPGNTCLSALRSGSMGTMEAPINNSKGCGTIMRMAPVGLHLAGKAEEAFKLGCELSAISHGHPAGYLSGGFFAALIAELAVSIQLEEGIRRCISLLKSYPKHEETLQAVEKALSEVKENGNAAWVPEVLGEAWVAEEALAISLYTTLRFQDNFEKGVAFAINHSGDSDSTGAIVGNLLGLIHGKEGIPAQLTEKLECADLVEQVGEDLWLGVKGDSLEMNPEWWEKYPGF